VKGLLAVTKTQITKLDKLFSQLIRSVNFCQWCGGHGKQLHTAHIFSRRFMNTRWDKNNAYCLCAGCHRKAHDRPTEWTDFIRRNLGISEYNKLRLKSYRLSVGNDRVKYEDILEGLA
jgi:5-methylcytosine-specific restriction endonuclease McrA